VLELEIVAKVVAQAYDLALSDHNEAIKGRNDVLALQDAIVFGIITAATAGGLGWVSTLLQAGATAARVALINTLEDAVQSGLGETIDAVQLVETQSRRPATTTMPDAGLPVRPMSGTAVNFLAAVDEAVGELRRSVLRYVNRLIKYLMALPACVWDGFDRDRQEQAHRAWLDTLPVPIELPENLAQRDALKQAIADELERALWKNWLPRLRTIRVDSFREFEGPPRVVFLKPTVPVENRLDALGITEASGVGDFGSFTSQAEIEMVVEWARAYSPRTLSEVIARTSVPARTGGGR
jgi:hypothetical protein